MKLSHKEQEELKQLQANRRPGQRMPIAKFRRLVALQIKAEATS